MIPPLEYERRFVEYLAKFVAAENRAALAALRRGLDKDPGEAMEMFPYVAPWLSRDVKRQDEERHYLVASLFAFHPNSWRGDGRTPFNLGASFAKLSQATDSASIEQRFVALLNSHRDDVSTHLRHAIGLLKSKEIPVDWAQLLYDLRWWGSEHRAVQREWARAFWGSPNELGAEELSHEMHKVVAELNEGEDSASGAAG